MAQGNLLRNCVLFGRLLRRAGVEVMPTQIVDLVESLNHIHIGSRADFKASAQAILVSRQEHLAIFEEAFDLFWQARPDNALQSLNLGSLIRRRQQPKPQQIKLKEESSDGRDADETPKETQIERILTYSESEVLRH